MKLGEIAYVTKLAGFEHTKYIQGNCVHEPLEGYIPLFIGKTVQQGEIDTQFDWYIAESISNQLQRSKLKRKCIVLPYVGTLGDMAIFSAEYDAHLGSNIAKIELNENSPYTEEFIYYYLKSTNGQKVLLRDQQGMIQKNITMEAIRNVELPDIDLEAQNRIVLTLDSISRKISLNRKANELLESMAKQLYDYWFVQFDFPNAEGKPYKSSGGKMVYNETLKRDIPEGWEVKPLNTHLKIISGFPFKSETYLKNGKYKVITIKNVQDGKLSTSSCDFVNSLPDRISSDCVLEINDRLISLTGNCGRVCVVTENDLLLNQRVGKFICKEYLLEFFYHLFLADEMRTVCDNLAKGAAQANLSPIELCAKEYYIPTSNILSGFNQIVNRLRMRITKNEQETLRLTSLRDYLLPLLMNGQVKVS